MPIKFFITHSWKDIDFARRLCDDLSRHGLEGFFDAYSIHPGDEIARRIAKGLEECDVYVPLLSPAAVESRWCEREIGIAIDLSMERERKGRPRIIPVIIQPCKLPTILRGILYISFAGRYDDALRELLTKGIGMSIAAPEDQKATRPTPQVIIPRPSIQTLPPTKIGKDGRERVLIPAGEFWMGSEGYDNEKPLHQVYLDAFYIDRYPVTNAAYKAFIDATDRPVQWDSNKRKIPRGKESHPVVRVDWADAVAYAKWVGGRLPTEAEWEKAASWDEVKQVKRPWPWGDTFDQNLLNSSAGGKGGTTPVGNYPGGASPYGVLDMAGNVWEWCADQYDAKYYRYSPKKNPHGPVSGRARVLRGGSWNSTWDFTRCAYRYAPEIPDPSILGFRVAESVSP